MRRIDEVPNDVEHAAIAQVRPFVPRHQIRTPKDGEPRNRAIHLAILHPDSSNIDCGGAPADGAGLSDFLIAQRFWRCFAWGLQRLRALGDLVALRGGIAQLASDDPRGRCHWM